MNCTDCDVDTSFATGNGHYYTLHDELWRSVIPDNPGGVLCLDCLEQRLEYPLREADFVATPPELVRFAGGARTPKPSAERQRELEAWRTYTWTVHSTMPPPAERCPDPAAFLASRRAAGAQIDPATAEFHWHYGFTIDPYGIYEDDLTPDERCLGRVYFARAPRSDVWVSFYDLPEATREALWARLELEPHLADGNDLSFLDEA